MSTPAWQSPELDEPRTEPEQSAPGNPRTPKPNDEEWGRSESLDPDNVGDIADEGVAHRA